MKTLKFGIFILLVLFSIFTSVNAQKKGTLGFSFSALNKNTMLHSAEAKHDFATTVGTGFISFEATYWHPVTQWLDFETGLNYSFQGFKDVVTNSFLGIENSSNHDVHMLNIPVGLRAEFLNFAFVNSGILVDLTHETGIGSYVGAGVKFDSPVGIGIFINPYLKMHSILPVNFNLNTNRVLEMGVKVGVSYMLDNPYRRR